MKRWIRWKGLIAFAACVVVIALVWVLVVDAVVRKVIETAGTRAVGARVDLDAADLSLFPTGLTLTGLAVTNPDAPMENAVEIGRMAMDLDPGYLIRRKVIVNHLQVEGLAFNTPRKTSGEVPELARQRAARKGSRVADSSRAAVEKVCGEIRMPSLEKPDLEAILAKEPLESIALAKGLDEKLRTEKARWEKELERLADEKTLAEYKQRIDKLKGSGGSLGSILGAAGEAQQLQADIQKDLKLIKTAQNTFTTEYKAYQQQVGDLVRAPEKDIRRLMDKYSLSPAGLANLSQLIFGQRLCGWVQTAADYYAKIKPYVGKASGTADSAPQERTPLRGKGKNIRFAETPPMPDFLIRSLNVDAALDIGKLTGKAENITTDQHMLGRPTTFAFLGREMQRIASLNLIGTVNFTQPGTPKSDLRLGVKGLGVKALKLIQEGDLPLTLKQAAGDLDLNLETVGDALDAVVKADFGNVEFSTGESGQATAVTAAIQSALAGVQRFGFKADVAGTLEAYTLKITSDLDRILKSAVGSLIEKEAAKFQAALQQRISAQLQDPLQQAQGSLSGLGGIETELANRLNLGNDLLKGLKLPF